MLFLKGFLIGMLKDLLTLFLLFYIGECVADFWKLSRMERAWWMALLTMGLLTFVLWFRFGRILQWI